MVRFAQRSRELISTTLGTLAALTALQTSTKIDVGRLQGVDPNVVRWNMDYSGKTAGDGPIAYGLSHNNSDAQIAEFFAADPQFEEDPGEIEESQREIWVLGVIAHSGVKSLDDPPLRRAKWPGWDVREGTFLNVFHFNLETAGNLVTGAVTRLYLEIYGEWLND